MTILITNSIQLELSNESDNKNEQKCIKGRGEEKKMGEKHLSRFENKFCIMSKQ